MNRFCDAMFCFCAGMTLAAFVLAQMWVMPQLFSAALWFAASAFAFWLRGWAQRRIERESSNRPR